MSRPIVVLSTLVVLGCAAGPAAAASKSTPTLNEQLMQLDRTRQHWKAFKLTDKALRRMDKAGKSGSEHTELLATTASYAMAVGERTRAHELYQRLMVSKRKTLGPDNPRLLKWLNLSASAANYASDHHAAERLYADYLRLADKKHKGGVGLVGALHQVGFYYQYRFEGGRAEPLFMRALKLTETHTPKDADALGTALERVAQFHAFMGDAKAALPFYRRVVATYLSSPETANEAVLPQRKLGELLDDLGKKAEATKAHAAADAAFRAAVARSRADSHDRMAWLQELGRFLVARGQYKEAIAELERARQIGRKLYGGKDTFMASGTLIALANAYQAQGRFADALAMHRLVAKLADAFPGLGPHVRGLMRVSVAYAEHRAGKLDTAAGLYRRIIKAQSKLYGANYARNMHVIEYLGQIHWLQNAPRKALAQLSHGFEIAERHLALTMSSGTEKDKRAYLDTIAHQLDLAATFADARAGKKGAAAALEHALNVAFARKGRLIDALANLGGALRARLQPPARKLMDALKQTRAQLATVVNRGPGGDGNKVFRQRVTALEIEAQRLERLLATQSKTYRSASTKVTADAVRGALPKGTALVEFVAYRPMDPKNVGGDSKTSRRLVAYVLRRGDDGKQAPAQAIELGAMAAVDKLVGPLLDALADPNTQMKRKARALDRLVMQRVRPLLGNATKVFIAPDGSLGLVPFAALVDEHGKFLVEGFEFTYLTSARDLLRTRAINTKKAGGTVIADPIFDKIDAPPKATTPTATPATPKGRRSRGLGKRRWKRLPGTANEARALAALIPKAVVVTGEAATEAALKKVAHPRILHVATHGYFMPDQVARRHAGTENPLLRSGLVLTGGNHLSHGSEDGVLTALEVAGLDLWGTRLVVLSACETGVGKVRMGEGVYGLRRALVLAGAESQVVSLWQVDDDATKELMVGFYGRLLKGARRSVALRKTQLGLLAKRETKHPFFWASFVSWGDPGPI